MSKLIALTAAGVGATGISVGGYYLFRNGGESAGVEKQTNTQSEQKATTPEVEDALKALKENKECITPIFSPDSISWNEVQNSATLPANDNEFFGDANSDTSQIKSCLLIKWDKKTDSSNSKWSGTFTWIWTFVNGDKGFINFNEATTTTSKKLSVKGGFYLLKKENTTWKIAHKKEVTSGKEIEKNELDTKFPKAKLEGIVDTNKDYWDFMDNNSGMDSICETESWNSGETTSGPTTQKFTWQSGNSGNKKVADWSSNLTWWENIYKENTDSFNLSTKLDSFTGTWAKDGASTTQQST